MVVHHRFIDPKMVVSFRGALLTRRNYIKNNLGYYFFFFSLLLYRRRGRSFEWNREEGSRLRNLNKSAAFVSLFVFVERSLMYYILAFFFILAMVKWVNLNEIMK